jgi:hypothetical protein
LSVEAGGGEGMTGMAMGIRSKSRIKIRIPSRIKITSRIRIRSWGSREEGRNVIE